MSDQVRVLIADDEQHLRDSFQLLVDSDPGCTVTGVAADGLAAVRLAAEHRPDVVLMDIRMPGLDGIEATRRICADPATAEVRVLMLTMFDLDPYVYAALRAGASGFLLKDIPPADLLNAVHVAASGHALFAPGVVARLIARFTAPAAPAAAPADDAGVRRLAGLTDRERQILRLIAAGLSNTQICQREHISMGTVKTHVTRLLAKLGARDRAQLVIAAYEGGLAPTTDRPGPSTEDQTVV